MIASRVIVAFLLVMLSGVEAPLIIRRSLGKEEQLEIPRLCSE
jgi:hypothetical protein